MKKTAAQPQTPCLPSPVAKIAANLRRLVRVCMIAAALLVVAGQHSEVRAQSIVALVGGDAITNNDIDQRIKLTKLTTQKVISRDEALEDLINDKVKIKEARKFGLELSSSDIDSAFGNMATRMRMNPEQLTKTLDNSGVRAEALKARIKADMTWSNLVRGRFQKSFDVSEKEIQEALGDKASSTAQTDSFEYVVRPIVLVVPRDSPASATELRRKEAELIRSRIETCDQAVEMFRSMRDAAIRDSVTKNSADLPQPLRELLDKTPVGKLTPPEVTRQGVEMVALCSRKQSTSDTPAKRQIREKIYNDRYEAKSKSYLQEARKSVMIEMR